MRAQAATLLEVDQVQRAQLDTAQAVIEQGGQDGAVTHAAHAAQDRRARPAARAPDSRQPPAGRRREYVLATNNIEHIFCSKNFACPYRLRQVADRV